MEPERLSASGIKCFEGCEARYLAEYVEKATEAGSTQGQLGTALHETIHWATVGTRPNVMSSDNRKALLDRFRQEIMKLNLDSDQEKAGYKMLQAFWDRWQENPPHEILMAEVKETFTLKVTKTFHIDVTYIWDRCDRRADGSIEVVDYKSWFQYVDVDEFHSMWQTRIYALAAMLRFKDEDPPAIWMTLDQLRHGPVRVKFTREDNLHTWKMLQDVAKRIRDSDGTIETVNPECRYCIRKASCKALARVVRVGNIQGMDIEEVAYKLAELDSARKAMEATMEEAQDIIDDWLQQHEVPMQTLPNGIIIDYGVTNRRKITDREQLAKILGPEIMAKYAKPGMEDLDEIVKSGELSDAQIKKIDGLIATSSTAKPRARFPKA